MGRFIGHRSSLPVWVLGLLIVLGLATPALAQTGRLRVRVADAQERQPLVGATVTISNDQGLLAAFALLSDVNGLAVFPVLRAGQGYIVQVGMPGFATQRQMGIRVQTDKTAEVAVLLSAELQERVQVREAGSVVDIDSVGATSKFSDAFIDALPVPGRFYQNTLTLAPGVNDADGDGNPTVLGSRARNFRAEVGGISNVDPLTGKWLSFVNPETIEVMDVITSGAGVEFGRAQGGFARIVQKQGTNRFEGVASFIYRTSKLDGNGAADGIPDALVPEFRWSQPSITLSGPIVRDKLWYRASHEWVEREDPVDTLGQIVPTTTDQRIFADQLTWQPSPRNKIAFQWQYDPLTVDGLDISSTVPFDSTRTLERGGPTYSITWTAPQSPRLLTEATVAWQDHFQNIIPTTTGERQRCAAFQPWLGWDALNDAFCHRSIYGYTSGSFPESSRDKRQRLSVHAKGTWFAGQFAGASHRLKFGLTVENERYFRELERGPEVIDVDPYIVDSPPDSFCHGCPLPKAFVTVRVPLTRLSTGTTTGNSWAIYGEDQIKPANNLTLTVGLRVDREEIDAPGSEPFDPVAELAEFNRLLGTGLPLTNAFRQAFTAYPDVAQFSAQLAESLRTDESNFSLGPGAIQSTFWYKKQRLDDISITNTNLSPRLTVAWDPTNRGRSKLSFSIGRYYDKIFLAVPLVEIEPLSTNLTFDADGTIIANQGSAGGLVFADGVSANDLLATINPTVSRRLVERNLKTPHQDEYVVTWEQTLWTESSLRVSLVRRNFENQLQDVDVNHVIGDKGRCLPAAQFGDPVVQPSPGSGFEIVDLHTLERYVDTNPGPGDGLIDDCTGGVATVAADRWGNAFDRRPIPDGLPDLYVQNPGWGEVLLLGNYNSAVYEGLVLELTRRFFRNWEMNASYVLSEVKGDSEDFDQLLGNERNLFEQEYGWLSHDQRHVFQLSAMTYTPWWGLRLGGLVRWESGTPYSILEPRLTVFASPPEFQNLARDRDVRFRMRYPTGQRNDHRNPTFWAFDARVAKELHIASRVNLQLTVEVFNLFNESSIQISRQVQGTQTSTRRFGRRWQVGLRLAF